MYANVLRDSSDAFKIAPNYGPPWRPRGYMMAKSTPKNGEPLDAMQLPKELSMLKVNGHTKQNSPEAKGNARKGGECENDEEFENEMRSDQTVMENVL